MAAECTCDVDDGSDLFLGGVRASLRDLFSCLQASPRTSEGNSAPDLSIAMPSPLTNDVKPAAKEKTTPPGPAKGKGKGKGGEGKGNGGSEAPRSLKSGPAAKQVARKPKVTPGRTMKPLWWNKINIGGKIGASVWDKVADLHESLPLAEFEERFGKPIPTKPSATVSPGPTNPAAKLEGEGPLCVFDLRLRAAREPELRRLPPSSVVVRAIEELAGELLSFAEAQRVVEFAVPSEEMMQKIQAAVKTSPGRELAPLEEYMLVVGGVSGAAERLQCWNLLRSCQERVSRCSAMLDDFDAIVDAVRLSRALPVFLGLVLDIGNFLNFSEEKSKCAVGFDIADLGLLDEVVDSNGRTIKEFALERFFRVRGDQAARLLCELAPVLSNVGRGIKPDGKINVVHKSVHIKLEDCEGSVSAITVDFKEGEGMLAETLRKVADKSHPFSKRVSSEFKRTTESIAELKEVQTRIRSSYDNLLAEFSSAPMESGTFCLLLDDLLVPTRKMAEATGDRSAYCQEVFCRPETLSVDDVKVLLGLEAANLSDRQPMVRPCTPRGGFPNSPVGESADTGNAQTGASLQLPSPSVPLDTLKWKAMQEVDPNALVWSRVATAFPGMRGLPKEDLQELERCFFDGSTQAWRGLQTDAAPASELEEAAMSAASRLPSAKIIVDAIVDLDPDALTITELQDFIEVLQFPSKQNQKLKYSDFLSDLRQTSSAVQLIEEQAISWLMVRKTLEWVADVRGALENAIDVADCIMRSETLPTFLGLVLAMGNHLNGGTGRGQADGFEISALELLEGVKDPTGKDLRQFVLRWFFREMPDRANSLLHDLYPCFHAVSRTLEKNEIGAETLSKRARHNFSIDDPADWSHRISDTKVLAETVASGLDRNSAFAIKMPAMLTHVQGLVDEATTLRGEAEKATNQLWQYLASPEGDINKLCECLDDLFVPPSLVANKGLEPDLVRAFTAQEPFKVEHLRSIWDLWEGDVEACTKVADPADAESDAERKTLDAEGFCRALMMGLGSAEDFAQAAQQHSACPGSRILGGSLGDVERGSMHPAVEKILFDPGLELCKALGPVEGGQGWHILWAFKKTRGMLSTTVRASHILIATGKYEQPSTERMLTLVTSGPTDGEEGKILQTCRRWSFANSLPPALGEAVRNNSGTHDNLRSRRKELLGRPGLVTLFKWRGSFITTVKGVLADISAYAQGRIMCQNGGATVELGRLLPAEEANSHSSGFEARLGWIEEGWQEVGGLLNPEGVCELQICLEGLPAGIPVSLRIRPTALVYACSQPGLRLALCSGTRRHDRCATLVRATDDGRIEVRIDNEDTTEILDPRPSNVLLAPSFVYSPGVNLVIFQGAELVDATVISYVEGNRHKVSTRKSSEQEGSDAGASIDIEFDLNEINHGLPTFDSAVKFECVRRSYCEHLVDAGSTITDAITGNALAVDEQLVGVVGERAIVAETAGVADIAQMAFDDLEWVSGQTISLKDRVWAQGMEGFVEHLDREGRCVVRLADGTTTAPLRHNYLKKAQPIAGVKSASFANVHAITDLVPILLQPNSRRINGRRITDPVLVRAGPGTGKTWSMQQLLHSLAKALMNPLIYASARRVPLLVPIQKLARMLRKKSTDGASPGAEALDTNLIRFFIKEDENLSAEYRQMLLQALDMHMLVVLMDGVDEAANVRQPVEDYVTKQLLPMGVPLVLTSRPEGIRKRLYAREFVILNLQPLTSEQQQQIAEKQLRGDAFFANLASLRDAREGRNSADLWRNIRQRIRGGTLKNRMAELGETRKDGSASKHFVKQRLLQGDTAINEDNFESALGERLEAFDVICKRPVLLSVLVCLLKGFWGPANKLPRDVYELYEMGVQAKVAQDVRRKWCMGDDFPSAERQELVRSRVKLTVDMLQAIATANHLEKRRTFQIADVTKALKTRQELLELWNECLSEGDVPLIRVLTLGEISGGEFQFSHLSFQEFLFIRGVCNGEADKSSSITFWSTESLMNIWLNDPFYKNTFALGRGHIGRALAEKRSDWSFDRHPRLSEIGLEGLRNLLMGATSLRSLDLSNVSLNSPAGVHMIAEAAAFAGLPSLKILSLRYCCVPSTAATSLGRLLASCPLMEDLDLEWNRNLLSTLRAVSELGEALGPDSLRHLKRLGLRWCHLPRVAKEPLTELLMKLASLREIDCLGNRRLDLAQPFPFSPSGVQ